MRSTDECEMSRSCQSATFSKPGMRLPRRTRASPQSCSHFTGLRLCGIALEPFCAPARERLLHLAHLGALEVTDLERERLDRRRRATRTRRAARRAGRVRAPASTAPDASPSCSHTYASTSGSTLEYVPTAPESLPTAMPPRGPGEADAVAPDLRAPRARAWRRTWWARRGCRGCARPSACRGARWPGRRSLPRGRRRRRASGRTARTRVTESAVSTTSLEVRP